MTYKGWYAFKQRNQTNQLQIRDMFLTFEDYIMSCSFS